MQRTFIALKVYLLALLCLAGHSCSNTSISERYIRVTVSGINNDVQLLRAFVSINEAMLPRSPRIFENNNSRFWIPIEQSTQGSVSIRVEALNDTCQIANGKVDGLVGNDQVTDLTVNLSFLPAKLCRITVVTKGEGSVSSNPLGISCGTTCEVDFPYGTTLTLTATPLIPTFPAAWKGLCEGKQGICTVTVKQSAQLGVDFVPKVCNSANWCWESPLPQGNNLYGTWAASDKTVYAVGDQGTIIKWNGAGWFGLESNTRNTLYAVYGFSANDVWAVGDGGVATHWDGVKWTVVSTGITVNLRAVWGTSSTDIWAGGDQGTFSHWNGAVWTTIMHSVTPITSIWGTAVNDIWAVGADENIRRWNGTVWSYMVPPATAKFNDVWSSATNDVWVSSDSGFWRWNGTGWQKVTAPVERYAYRLRGISANNIWAIGDASTILRWQGTGWVKAVDSRGASQNLAAVDVRGAEAWFVGSDGLIVHWDGSNWQDSSRNLTPTNVRAGCGLSGDDAWLVGDAGSTYRWRGLAFTPVPTPTTNNLKEVWCGPPSIPGMPTDAVWAIGENGTALFWNGFDWSVAATGLTESLTGITGSSNNDVWISGTSTLLHWNGSSFEKFPNQGGRAKVSTAGGELFGVSSGAILSQFKQGAWQDLKPSTTCAIQTVVATGNDIYIGGSVAGKLMPGCIRKWTGSDWLDVLKPNYIVTDMIATSPSDIWSLSANYNGEVYHYNGLAWQLTDTGTRTRFERIFASGPKDRFIISSTGVILHQRD